MRQQTTTNTVLEMYGPNDEVWHEPLGAMYDEPKRTAHLGHEREASRMPMTSDVRTMATVRALSFGA